MCTLVGLTTDLNTALGEVDDLSCFVNAKCMSFTAP